MIKYRTKKLNLALILNYRPNKVNRNKVKFTNFKSMNQNQINI